MLVSNCDSFLLSITHKGYQMDLIDSADVCSATVSKIGIRINVRIRISGPVLFQMVGPSWADLLT